MKNERCLSLVLLVASAIVGCAGRPSLFPNNDPALRKTSAQFAADAARRQPFKTDLPSGGKAPARAEVDYMLNQIEVANLSQQDWQDVELWVNRKYVVFLPKMEPQKLKNLPFAMIYDAGGNSIPASHLKEKVTKLEAVMNGKLYDIPVKLAD
jgi:hypothetical protein